MIREKMEETRTDLSNKLEQLEKQVVDTVQNATNAVAESVQTATSAVNDTVQSVKDVVDTVKDSVEGTVESVKDTVQGTVDSVKAGFDDTVESMRQTFDMSRQMEHHPWLMLGGAVAVGFVAGKMLDFGPPVARTASRAAESLRPVGGRFAESASSLLSGASSAAGGAASAVGSAASALGGAASTAGSMLGTLEKMFGPEIDQVKQLAIGTLLGVVRDMAVQAAPENMAPKVREIIDNFTSKMGGKPIEGPVLPPRPSEEETADGARNRF